MKKDVLPTVKTMSKRHRPITKPVLAFSVGAPFLWMYIVARYLKVTGPIAQSTKELPIVKNEIVMDALPSKITISSTQLSDNETFQPINDDNSWVYSAYYDVMSPKLTMIRVIGIATRTNHTVFCLLNKDGYTRTNIGNRVFLLEDHAKNYTATMFECVVEKNFKPTSISITYKPDDTPTNLLEIQYPKQRERNFTVCYPALFGYNNISRIIQAIEINRVLGAQHFFIYNYSISREMDAVLRHYQDEGVLTVLQWPLPLDDVMHVWYYGQMSAINDCVYRNKFVSQYVVIQDPDEFIIPNHHMTWSDLIEAAEREYQSKHKVKARPLGSFTFESAFFNTLSNSTLWEQIKKNFSITTEEENFFQHNKIFPYLHVRRHKNVLKSPIRSKTIVRPEYISYSGIHVTFQHRDDANFITVSQNLSIVHHYRDDMVLSSSRIDTSALRFKDNTLPLLRRAYTMFVNETRLSGSQIGESSSSGSKIRGSRF
ncbi:beta-1,4-galactosyltransferase galt-1-like [Physella acuta]|uniref:beta-1,4-galactosyltransferase galt-1-like n=1 Tax=Physella acuta TaxID=109671 RepID=UPI0027DDD517|nr:beta-1,4-galactosyltransferase galt-1-like [Physella acuta]